MHRDRETNSLDNSKSVWIHNGYLCVLLVPGRIAELSGDFTGRGMYGANVFSGGLSLVTEYAGSVSHNAMCP